MHLYTCGSSRALRAQRLNRNGQAKQTSSSSETRYISIQIDPVNDAPIIDLISDQQTDEDTSLTLILSAFDIDGY